MRLLITCERAGMLNVGEMVRADLSRSWTVGPHRSRLSIRQIRQMLLILLLLDWRCGGACRPAENKNMYNALIKKAGGFLESLCNSLRHKRANVIYF